jgi:pimeloyl-ACP methyl ester carboxylesterase
VRRAVRLLAATLLLAGGAFLVGSWVAGRRLAKRLISAQGLAPAPEGRDELIAALRSRGASVRDLRHRGSPRDPVGLAAIFASPDSDPGKRPTILFLHGKGGNSIEWRPEAVRALDCGYNVLLPDLRGHGESRGEFVTYGYLEKEDLAEAISAAREQAGMDPLRLGLHGCSAGAALAIEFAANRPGIAALWLESPYADPTEMACHYLSIWTGIPPRILRLTSRFAVRAAMSRVRRALRLEAGEESFETNDPVRSIGRVGAPVCLVYGEKDELVPPRFAARLEASLPARSSIWRASNAGHCHHDDEPAKVATEEYDRRWREFFGRHLPVPTDL